MNEASLRRRIARLERIQSRRPVRRSTPDFAAAFAEVERAAAFLLTAWRVARINVITPEALGFPPAEDFTTHEPPTSTSPDDWSEYQNLVSADLLRMLSPGAEGAEDAAPPLLSHRAERRGT